MELPALLAHCGLNEKQALTYLAILELGQSTIKPISERAGLKRTSLYNFIDELVGLGIVGKILKRGRHYYYAENPTRLVELQTTRLKQVEAALPELLNILQGTKGRPKISYLEGPKEVRNIVREEPRCTKEALYIWPGKDTIEMIGGVKFMGQIDQERIRKGVRVKAIRFRDKDVKFPTSAQNPEFLREMRFAPSNVQISMGLSIYDTGKVGFFSSTREGFGIMIESQELTELMRCFFGLLWDRSTPAKLGEG
jgi:sugar-specific transcriptional regulator TrmB